MRWLRTVMGFAVLAAWVVGPAGANHGGQAPSAVILMREFAYDTGTGIPVLQVAAGDLLLFVNVGTVEHTVDAVVSSNGAESIHSGPVFPGGHVALTLAPGVYELHCETSAVHTALMRLVVHVS